MTLNTVSFRETFLQKQFVELQMTKNGLFKKYGHVKMEKVAV